ncbi:Uncharacterised protein [Salmonella enterica subsp. enterica serovar Typhi]|nr:Uncharacterised protein [Salmonella enterica subsp. enterica serovar Typhi]CQV80973.1 Uncharacterised protein [Salmonella enterica subsp. enterica serovar Typhi]
MRAQRAARHHHFKARVIIKNVRDAQAIGDNAQMIMVEQRARHLLNRRSNRDKYRGAIRNIVSHGFRNGFFLLRPGDLSLLKGGIDHTGRSASAAVMTRNQPLLA